MPVKIRLSRHGRKRKPFYHIVVTDSRAPRDGRYIEKLGKYNPNTNPATIELNFEKALDWVQKGAQPTDTCRAILSYRGVMYKKHLLEGVKKKAFSEEEAETKFQEWLTQKEAKIEANRESISKKASDAEKARLAAEKKISDARAEALAKRNSDLAEAAAAETAEDVAEEAPVAEEAKEETPAEEAKTEPVAEEVKEETPAEETKEEPVAEEVKEEAPAEEAKAEPVAEEVKEETPAEETKEEPVAEEVPAEEKPAEAPEAEAKKKRNLKHKILIDQDNHSIIGSIVKPHGIDGTLNIRLNGSFADEIKLEEPLFILLDGAMVPFFIEEIRPAGNSALVKLEFIDSEDKARVLNGKELFVERKRQNSYSTNITLSPMQSLIGFTLSDKNSDFSGLIEDFIESELNPLLLVKSGKKEWMIPYQSDLIVKIDQKNKIVFINLPEGLIY